MKKILVFLSLTISLALIIPSVSYADCRFDWSEGAYCGSGKTTRVIPDKLFGPFSNACRTHDWCYHAAAEQIAKEIQEGYLRGDPEIDNRRDNSRRQCDSYFSQEILKACSKSLFPDCRSAAITYIGVVKLAGNRALKQSIRRAKMCR